MIQIDQDIIIVVCLWEGVSVSKITNTISFISLADRPSCPQNLRVTEVHKDYACLAWDIPESDGGSPITGYNIEKRDASKTNWMSAGNSDGKTLNFRVTRLFEGTDYHFRVTAENKIGTSEPTELDKPVTAKLPFGEYLCFFSLNCLISQHCVC